MAAKNVLTDVIVAVRPISWHDRASLHKQTMDCEYILKDIKRHVDDLGHCEIEKKYERQCEFCGSRWSETVSDYNGGCCEKDEANKPECYA